MQIKRTDTLVMDGTPYIERIFKYIIMQMYKTWYKAN